MNSEPTEQEKIRNMRYECLSCARPVTVGVNYPPAVVIPRTLELYCKHCGVINILYQPAR